MNTQKVILVVGARPNFMKIAPIMREMAKYPDKFDQMLVHTGQHYDEKMSQIFFKDLDLPKPDVYLGVGSGTHAEQTGRVMVEFEKVCMKEAPNLVIVVGDVNSTLACALVASKLCIPLAHVEAGLRSFDRTMPEEINRILTDRVSDYLFTSCEDAAINLVNEGISEEKIHFVGNVMIDSLKSHMRATEKSNILNQLNLYQEKKVKKYALVTLHRPSNVDEKNILEGILFALNKVAEKMPVLLPIHPRTKQKISDFHLQKYVTNCSEGGCSKNALYTMSPVGYIDFLKLMSKAAVILTDSGGIQEETTILKIPCLTLRENTERPVTITEGSNQLVGNNPERIIEAAERSLIAHHQKNGIPKYWDGHAARRILDCIVDSKN